MCEGRWRLRISDCICIGIWFGFGRWGFHFVCSLARTFWGADACADGSFLSNVCFREGGKGGLQPRRVMYITREDTSA